MPEHLKRDLISVHVFVPCQPLPRVRPPIICLKSNILNILQIGGGLATIEFEFQASSAFTDLTFQFDAATVADANLLGSISGNQTVLEFSNFSLSPVPEPGSLILASLGMLVILRRRRFMA